MPQKTDAQPHHAVTLVFVTWFCLRAYWWTSMKAGRMIEVVSVEALLKLTLWLPICLLVVWLMYRKARRPVLAELGLGRGLSRGLLFGVVATIPMLGAVVLLPRRPFDVDLAFGSAMIGPLAEELLFRGFLFQQFVRRAGWSVPVAMIVSSVLFGLAHARGIDMALWTALRGPQLFGFEFGFSGQEVVHFASGQEVWWGHLTTRLPFLLASGLPYAAGGAVFAWIAYRWKSLWPAIALHGFINFWWDLTQGEHARLVFQFDLLSAAQALSVVLAIGLTIRWTQCDAGPANHEV